MTNSGSQAPYKLRLEYLENPLGIDELHPRFSWYLDDARRGARQTAWQVQVATSLARLESGHPDLWDSGRVASSETTQVSYAGKPLASRQRCFWRVRSFDGKGLGSPFSRPAWWEMSLCGPQDWSALWIGYKNEAEASRPVYLRRDIHLAKPIRRARLYATALGVYQLRLNGRRVGDQELAPGWTDYRKRIHFQTYDVTDLLSRGDNALGAILGSGWYIGPLSWGMQPNMFGAPPARLLLQLEVEHRDGSTSRFVTGEGRKPGWGQTESGWKASLGPILSSDLYGGESQDARLELGGWDRPGYDDKKWKPAQYVPEARGILRAEPCEPIRITQILKPLALRRQSAGVYIYDMGQNMVGFCRIMVRGRAGSRVRLRHAEILKPDGGIDVSNLRRAACTDTFVLAGKGEESFTPHFTYHGFRYVEVTGLAEKPLLDDLEGLVFHSAAPETGRLETSSALVNKIQENIRWGLRGNLHSIPTDCPQRDERLGWMGDAQIIARTACLNLDSAAFLGKFTGDIRDAQSPDGAYANYCPDLTELEGTSHSGAAAWMDAGVIVPWTLWQVYGDRRILENNFASVCRYVDYLDRHNPSGIWLERRGHDYGDWLSVEAESDKDMFATLHFFRSADLASSWAGVLGRRRESSRYAALAARIRQAYNRKYFKNGRYLNQTQTLLVLALAFGMAPDKARGALARHLVDDIRGRGWHLSTGFNGTRWLLPVLSEAGFDAVAHRILLNRTYPGWGYSISKGATTIWERWNGDTEGPSMNSFNHYSFGAVGEWMMRYLAGIDTVEGSAYRELRIQPRPAFASNLLKRGEALTRVASSFESPSGRIENQWEVKDGFFSMKLRIPPNVTARVVLPGQKPVKAVSGVHEYRLALKEHHGNR